MRSVTIPIRSLMPAPDDAVEYMPMPREMTTFEMPRLPEPGPGNDVAGARDVLDKFLSHIDSWLEAGGEPPALDLAGFAPDALRVLNETLGEGEVAAIVNEGPRDPHPGNRVLGDVARTAFRCQRRNAARLPDRRVHSAGGRRPRPRPRGAKLACTRTAGRGHERAGADS